MLWPCRCCPFSQHPPHLAEISVQLECISVTSLKREKALSCGYSISENVLPPTLGIGRNSSPFCFICSSRGAGVSKYPFVFGYEVLCLAVSRLHPRSRFFVFPCVHFHRPPHGDKWVCRSRLRGYLHFGLLFSFLCYCLRIWAVPSSWISSLSLLIR